MASGLHDVLEPIVTDTVARCVLPHFRALRDDDISQKSPGNYLTVADTACERMLTERLGKAFPHAQIVGEENYRPGMPLRRDGLTFVIDPIDGTIQFKDGDTQFATMVSALQDGELFYTAVYSPCAARDRMLHAEKDKGIFADGKPVTRLTHGTGLVWGDRHAPPANLASQIVHHVNSNQVARGMALGGDTGFCYGTHAYFWDYLPLILIAHETGGKTVSLSDGQDLMSTALDHPADCTFLSALDASAWPSMRAAITPHAPLKKVCHV